MEYINPLKIQYPVVIRITGLIGVGLVIMNFLIFPRFQNTMEFEGVDQIIIENIDIPQTQQIDNTPPPARPSIPVPSDDEDIADELRNRAKDALLTQAIASQEDLSKANVADDLINMDGMDDVLALALSKIDITCMEDLAEQSIDELLVIEGMNETRAGELIMTARAPWFEETE